MDYSAIEKQAQPLERPYKRQIGFKGTNCQPLTGLKRQSVGLGKDVFISSRPGAGNSPSFSLKIKNAVNSLANKFN